ncbi:MAG: EAL domain-containing protein [Pseudomonadota bacterium]
MQWLPQRLAPRLVVGTLAITLGVVCVVSLALFANSRLIVDRFLNDSVDLRRDYLERQIESRAQQSTAALEREIDALARDQRFADLQRALDESASIIPDVTLIQAVDTEGKLLASAGRLPTGQNVLTGEPGVSWERNAFTVTQNIIQSGVNHGRLRLRFSLDGMTEQLRAFENSQLLARRDWQVEATRWVLLSSLLMALLSGTLSLLVARQLIRPIEAITDQARRLEQGDYGQPLLESRADELGRLNRAFNSMRDQLRQTTISRDYMDQLLSSMSDALIVTDDHGTITHCNAAASRLTGFTETQLLGRAVATLVHEDDRQLFAESQHSDQPKELRLLTADDETVPVSLTCSVANSGGTMLSGRIYSAQNVTERKRSEARIRYLARMDPMTKVPNRMQFQHLLQRAIARARKSEGMIALFYLDVDQFKDINDTFGHLAGDTTLETITQCMRRALPDNAVIGRLSGDEFAAFVDELPPVEDVEDALQELARNLLAEVAEPFDVQANEVYVTASVGIAIYPQHADNVIDLLRNSDAALYSAKKAGGNRHVFYDSAMNDAAVERLLMKSRLRRSFERDELLLEYQPKYDLSTGKVMGAEALVRWHSPDIGRIQPNDFIPLAEETNLIVEIGEWVIDRVCEDLARWQDTIGDPGRIAINLSLKQLRQRNFFNSVSRIFQRHGIKPTDIEFEITESVLAEDIGRTVQILETLSAYGLQLAIDDFGTGYSSLTALQKFPIKTLKIDRSFVTNAAHDANDAAIIRAIIDMSRSLELDVVAEGIETQAQLEFLRSLKCDFGQGMLFGEPMDASAFSGRLEAQQDGTDQHKALFA